MKKLVNVSILIPLKITSENTFSLWMQERKEEGPLNGKWEFPGGKIEINESALDAVIRETKEEIDVEVDQKKIKPFKLYPYSYSEKRICLFAYILQDETFNCEKGKWFELNLENPIKEISKVIPSANVPIINEIAKELREKHLS